jgi:hypothetical protein
MGSPPKFGRPAAQTGRLLNGGNGSTAPFHPPPRPTTIPTLDVISVFVSQFAGASAWVAVGTALASGPPHGSVQAGLRHTALTAGKSGQPLLRPGMENAGRG